ncbi:hypothetical protein C8F04DRAFT_1252502 [Mycena alexandri]|uniref:Restriction of telomere capping protein 4 n=1 Tax=Mycena alexandri TaxID=1745969 RepID=A0AAD6T9K1_9AGAR|nr:hypothetical protein C8F04DRAFT_1252502 [Mycena alexandri]
MGKRKIAQPDDPSERIRGFGAFPAHQAMRLSAKLQKSTSRVKLIPRPKGQAGRGSESGGYNLQEAMGLKDDDERYLRQNRIVKRYVQEKLSVFKTISKQDRGQVARVISNIQKDFPFFKRFEDGWPIHDMIRVYLSNEQTRARRDVEAELGYDDNSDSVLLNCTANTSTKPKETTNHRPKVTFSGSDEEAQADDEEELPPRKKAVVFPRKKQQNVVFSEPEDSDDDDLAKLIASSGKTKKPSTKIKPHDKEEEEGNKENIPTKSKKRKADTELAGTAEKKVKLNAAASKLGTAKTPKPIPKLKQKSTAPKSLPTPPPSKHKSKDDPNSALTWEDLPQRCPAAECSDKLPSKAVPSILSLFNKLQTNGPDSKGSHLIQLEICVAITREKRREPLSRLGNIRRWPTTFDYDDLSNRIFALKPEMESLITSSYQLDSSPFWDDFLFAINYQLADFCGAQSKIQFPAARNLKCCGYFGPQGQFIIESCLLRMVEELKLEHNDLEAKLLVTLHTAITAGKNSEQFEYDEDSDLAASNYLSLRDFSDYVLLPFVSSSLILQDLPGLETLQDAIFEKRSSTGFGEFFAPEDDTQEEIHTIHRQNLNAIRGLQFMKDAPSPPSTAPPRLRKLVKQETSFKIRLPAIPPPPDEKEVTLDDFPAPTKKKKVTQPKPKSKAQKKQESNPIPKPTITSVYSTRSKGKVDPD